MTRFLYLRLAAQNLRRNKQTYGPFLLASSLLTFALYSLAMLAFAPVLDPKFGATGDYVIRLVLTLGMWVVGTFTVIFMVYADGFLIRRRKKELGLYGVLGMERRHVMRVQAYELVMSFGLTLLIGLGLGMMLARLLFLGLRALTHLNGMAVSGAPSPVALCITCGIMGVIFLLLLIRHGVEVARTKPIDMLHAQQKSEKEPKARWLQAVLGVVMMVGGYVLAAMVDNPMTAIGVFFVAVLLVIFGTYEMFLTTSIALLKAMKMRKNFYYKPKHFVTVSGMLYRMKQNAMGLASIAILSTMAMVTLGTTSALYLGAERTLNAQYPMDAYFTVFNEQDAETVAQAVNAWTRENRVEVRDMQRYRDRQCVAYVFEDGTVDCQMDMDEQITSGRLFVLDLMPQEEYNAYAGVSLTLAEDEIAVAGDQIGDTVTIGERTWRAVPMDAPALSPANNNTVYLNGSAVLVFPTEEQFAQATLDTLGLREKAGVQIDYVLRWNWVGGDTAHQIRWSDEVMDAARNALREASTDGKVHCSVGSRASASNNFYQLYGSLLFIGLFLGLVFLMGTLLIIYFKQLSEGYQDHDRYIILQKVGMSQREVRQTVRRQILLVFLAPLAVALCHVAGSLHMISLMLQVFGLLDVTFIALCAVGASVLVALSYLLFYRRTARTYYKLVRFTGASAA